MKNDRENDQELYKAYLADTKKEMGHAPGLSEEKQKRIIKLSKNSARLSNIMITAAILLLILPVTQLLTFLYYGAGGKANELIDVTSKTIYVTEPNMSLEEIELEEEIGFFSMNLLFDVYKRIGRDDYDVGDYDVHFAFGNAMEPQKQLSLERPLPDYPSAETEYLYHPDAPASVNSGSEWEVLDGLPDGTVAEIYLSFYDLAEPASLEKWLPVDTELRWIAVDTGVEAAMLDSDGDPVSALGYPAQIDDTTWSPFNGREQTNEEVFIDILKLLKEHEQVAVQVARAKNLSMAERLDYLDKNGIKAYGAVVTGPTAELRKLADKDEIRTMKVGEVKLWNWK